MPHTTVEYSGSIADAFDRTAFAQDLHDTLVSLADVRAAGCKTRFVRRDDVYIGDGSPHYALLHTEIAVVAGRTTETKRAVNEAVLALLRKHTAPIPEHEVQFSVTLRDLDSETYVKHDEPRTAS
ncbi:MULTISPECIES: 5-carboxymethyl-2-hydroxymuconate Delta-isomerase [unclassified Streptomyces]|uniref:5-carboxymethyl-2-hydroxymuconate Delta-isomerase n=1 Tax=unclassified Streptomyces TaxID=2593676 RepID=UPI002E2DD4B5|nr:isomerase [Streptomyces sp. NBC_00223]